MSIFGRFCITLIIFENLYYRITSAVTVLLCRLFCFQAADVAPPPADPPVERHSCGALDAACRHCAALHFEGERTQRGGFSECCAQGKVALQPLGPTPRLLELLLTGDEPDSRNFQGNIRRYNSALAMASFVSEVETPPGE